MDRADAASQDEKKKARASLRRAGRKAVDIAAVVADMAPPGSRLTIDMPIGGSPGQVRLVLSEPRRRVSVWGKDMKDAMDRLVAKATG